MCRNRKQHVQKPDKVFFFYFFYFSSEAIYTTQQLLFIEHLITIALITPTVLLILNFEYVKIHPGANSAVKTNLAQHAMLTGWHQLRVMWGQHAKMWPFHSPAKLSIIMYEDGITAIIAALHTSVQPSVNCIMPELCMGHTGREILVSASHTCVLIRVKVSVNDSKVHTWTAISLNSDIYLIPNIVSSLASVRTGSNLLKGVVLALK